MFLEKLEVPSEWTNRPQLFSIYSQDYELVDIPAHSYLYLTLNEKVRGSFNINTKRILRVENPYLYAQYLLKKQEYISRGGCRVVELFHDTAESKISSIVSSNLDWRLVNRVKYGKGVSFSPSPAYANKQSSRANGTNRAMIVADVLVNNIQPVNDSVQIPNCNYDTTMGNCGNVYVKFYDNEFYPKYVVYYDSTTTITHYRRRYW